MNNRNSISVHLNRYLQSNERIVDIVKGVIGKYNTKSCVVITGIPFDDNASFYKELNLIVITKKCTLKVPLKPGYNPKAELFNFNGCGNNIYVTIDSGGSGGFQFFYIFEFDNCKLKLLMSDDIFNEKFDNYTGQYLDYYRAQVVDYKKVWRMDISCKGYDYLSQIYYADGRLIEPKQIYISAANYTFPQYYTPIERYTLVVYQKVTGLYQADSLGYMETTLKFENDKYSIVSVYLKTSENDRCDCIAF